SGQHGFLYSRGAYQPIDYPGATATVAYRINNFRQVVGYALIGSTYSGFVYDIRTNTFALVNYPGAHSTFPLAINDFVLVAGKFSIGTAIAAFACGGSHCWTINRDGINLSLMYGVTDTSALYGYANTQTTFINFRLQFGRYDRFQVLDLPDALFQ